MKNGLKLTTFCLLMVSTTVSANQPNTDDINACKTRCHKQFSLQNTPAEAYVDDNICQELKDDFGEGTTYQASHPFISDVDKCKPVAQQFSNNLDATFSKGVDDVCKAFCGG